MNGEFWKAQIQVSYLPWNVDRSLSAVSCLNCITLVKQNGKIKELNLLFAFLLYRAVICVILKVLKLLLVSNK